MRATQFIKGVAEGKDDKIAQLKKDHDTAVHWSKNEKSPQKREAARQKAEKIKRHLETQYKQGVAEGSESSIEKKIQAKQDSLSLAREQRRARGQRQQGQREIKLQAEIDKLNTELTQLKQQGVAEGLNEDEYDKYEAGVMDESEAVAKMFTRLARQGRDPLDIIANRFGWGTYELDDLAQEHGFEDSAEWLNSFEQGVAEGLSKRDQQDVAAIRAAIARLEAQLNHPNADRDAIQQSIAHEKKRLALYGQGVAEGNQEEKIGGRYDADEFDSMVARLKKLAGAGPMRTVYDPDRRVYRNMPSAQQPAQQPKKAPR